MKCQLVGFVRRDYVKDGKDGAVVELHLARAPFSTEKGFNGHVTKKYVVFGLEACNDLPKLIVGEQYSVETFVSNGYENIADMVLLPKS